MTYTLFYVLDRYEFLMDIFSCLCQFYNLFKELSLLVSISRVTSPSPKVGLLVTFAGFKVQTVLSKLVTHKCHLALALSQRFLTVLLAGYRFSKLYYSKERFFKSSVVQFYNNLKYLYLQKYSIYKVILVIEIKDYFFLSSLISAIFNIL